jgi:hypothetical protein
MDVATVSQLQQAAARSAGEGNIDGADAITRAVDAMNRGIQPSHLEVSVGGEVGRYEALVIGVVEPISRTDSIIRRTLVAWQKEGDRLVALLDVTTLADVGSFGSEFEPPSDPRSRAQGSWIDFVRDSRWIATAGTAELALGALGGACHSRRIDERCVLAEYRVSIDGLFRLHGASPDAGLPAVRIQTAAGGVNGLVMANSNDGRGRRDGRDARERREQDRTTRRTR